MIRLILALWTIRTLPMDCLVYENPESDAIRAAKLKALAVLNRWLS